MPMTRALLLLTLYKLCLSAGASEWMVDFGASVYE
jgi:hypothetical protein